MTCMFCFFFFSKHSDKYKQKVHRIYIYQTCTHLKDFFLREGEKKKERTLVLIKDWKVGTKSAV